MPRNPTMVEVMSQILDSHGALMGVCSPGVVEAFDRDRQTAQVRIVTLKADGSARPVLPNCPVIFPGAYWDIPNDTGGILILADEDWRTWWRTDEPSVPESQSSHELSNAFFIPGLTSLPNARTLPAGAAVLEKPVPGGTVRLGAHTADGEVVHDDLLADLSNYLWALDIWAQTGHANWAAAAAAYVAGPAPLFIILNNGIGLGSYQSSKVLVEK